MKIHELSNLELFEAIKQTYDMIGATHTSLRRFGPSVNTLKPYSESANAAPKPDCAPNRRSHEIQNQTLRPRPRHLHPARAFLVDPVEDRERRPKARLEKFVAEQEKPC